MKVLSLKIEKRQSYDDEYPNEIVGIIQIVGSTGKMEVRLPPKTVAEIFRLCTNAVQKIADFNASQAGTAVELVADSIDLQIENNDLKQLYDKS